MYYKIRKVQRLYNVVKECEKDQERSNFIFQTKDVMFRSCDPLLKYDLLSSPYRKVNLIKKHILRQKGEFLKQYLQVT